MSAEVDEPHLPLAGFASVSKTRRGFWTAIRLCLRDWRERERQRRELSMLSDRDFAGLRVPRMLVAQEVRKWPWQKWHPQWEELEAQRREVVRRLRSL